MRTALAFLLLPLLVGCEPATHQGPRLDVKRKPDRVDSLMKVLEAEGVKSSRGEWYVDSLNGYQGGFDETLLGRVSDPIRPFEHKFTVARSYVCLSVALQSETALEGVAHAQVTFAMPLLEAQSRTIHRTENDGKVWWSRDAAQIVDGGFTVSDIRDGAITVFVSDGEIHHGERDVEFSMLEQESEMAQRMLQQVETVRSVMNSEQWKDMKHEYLDKRIARVEQAWLESDGQFSEVPQ